MSSPDPETNGPPLKAARSYFRYLVLAAAVLVQTCTGGLYAWSEFVPYLTKQHGLSTFRTQLIFGCLIAVFTLSMVVAGRWLRRLGPRITTLIGGAFFGAGYLVAAASGGDFYIMLLGIGGLTGIGTGFCYVSPLILCARWFPRYKGLVTGVAVAGFGGGAVVLSQLGDWLLTHDMGILEVFGWVGGIYGAVILVAALPLRFPGDGAIASGSGSTRALLGDARFWGLVLGMFTGTFAGLMVVGNLKPLLTSRGAEEAATTAIGCFAIGNAIGRVAWGWISDRIGAATLPLSLAALAGAVLLTAFLPLAYESAIALALLLGFSFGACFIVYAARTASLYGPDRMASAYPLIFLAYGVSGIAGPSTGGWIYDHGGSYFGALMVAVALLVVGAVGAPLLGRSPRIEQPVL